MKALLETLQSAVTSRLDKLVSLVRMGASPWLTPVQAAAYMHQGKGKVDQWIRSGKLRSYRDPEATNGKLVHKSDCDALIRSWPSGAKTPDSLRLSA